MAKHYARRKAIMAEFKQNKDKRIMKIKSHTDRGPRKLKLLVK